MHVIETDAWAAIRRWLRRRCAAGAVVSGVWLVAWLTITAIPDGLGSVLPWLLALQIPFVGYIAADPARAGGGFLVQGELVSGRIVSVESTRHVTIELPETPRLRWLPRKGSWLQVGDEVLLWRPRWAINKKVPFLGRRILMVAPGPDGKPVVVLGRSNALSPRSRFAR